MTLPSMPTQYVDELLSGMKYGEKYVEQGVKNKVIPGIYNKSTDAVPHEVIEAVVSRESNWIPSATNPNPCWTGGHAEGLGQFCSGPRNEPGGGSLEVSDYQAVTGQRITRYDIFDPAKSLELVSFGLNDRFARLKKQNPNEKNWFKAASGYSPRPGYPEEAPYLDDLKDYVTAYYGANRTAEIESGTQGTSASGGSLSECGPTQDCSKYAKWNPSRAVCEASNAGVKLNCKFFGGKNLIGTTDEEINDAAKQQAFGFLTQYAPYLAGGALVLVGVLVMAMNKSPVMQAAKAIA